MTNIYITGIGIVSPLALNAEDFFTQYNKQHPIPANHPCLPAQAMPIAHTYGFTTPPEIPRDPSQSVAASWAIYAAKQALSNAGFTEHSHKNIGVFLGNAMGHDQYEAASLINQKENAYFPFDISLQVAKSLLLSGPNQCISTACSAGLYSIAQAYDYLQAGVCDIALVGGSETVSRVAMGCFNRLRAVDANACRPFSHDRAGTIMGEGAVILVLETQRSLNTRHAPQRYASLLSYGTACEAYHATIPKADAECAILAATRALDHAAINADQIELVLAHGTGTLQNDAMETLMIHRLFDKTSPYVTAIKSKLGHQGGAAGAFQAAMAALALHHQAIPANGVTQYDANSCQLNLAPAHAQSARLSHTLLNSYAFGGNNISMIMGAAHANN